ncbi:MAG: hypothetical protein N2043_00830 [Ignavibacterium sp.]|nr:hypothetical protein [Ignavibacterium sp.]
MTTLPPPKTKEFPQDSLEKKVYNLVESFKDYIPITNDRYRLAFSLFKYLKGEGDEPLIAVKSNKLKLVNISETELAIKLAEALNKLK